MKEEDQFHHVIRGATEQLVTLSAETQRLWICCFHGDNKTVCVSRYEIHFLFSIFLFFVDIMLNSH